MSDYGIYETVVCFDCGRSRRRKMRAEIRPSRCMSCACTDRNKRRAREGFYDQFKRGIVA